MNRLLLSLAAALLVAAAALWFFASVDIVPTTRDVPAEASIQSDPWAALSRGVDGVSRFDVLDEIDLSEAGFVAAYWYDLKDQPPDVWLDWIQGGGRLLVIFEEGDEWEGDWADVAAFANLGPTDRAFEEDSPHARFEGRGPDVSVDPSLSFGEAEGVVFSSGGLPALILRNLGSGWILASGAPVYLHNEGLAEDGNRRFAEALLRGLDGRAVWLPAVPTPPKVDGVGGPVLALSLLLLAALVYWRAGPRLGPILDAGVTDRLGLAERLLAEGRFLWRQKSLPHVRERIRKTQPLEKEDS